MMTNTFALTASLFTGPDRGRAMGLSGGLVSAIGFTLGPVVGGFITFTLGWRYIFFISGALSFIGLAAARFLLLDDRGSGGRVAREPFDFIGAGLFAVGLTFLLLGITRGGLGYWGFPLSALFLTLFVWREATCPYPILDLALLRIVPFAVGNLARLCTFVALSTNELMMPFLLQLVLRMDPLEAGSMMTATALVLMVVSPSAGWLTDRIGSTLPAAAGATVVAVAMYAMSLLGPDSGPAEIVPRLALLGVGLGLFQTPNNHSLVGSVPPERLGIASSVISIIRSVGRSLGTAIATAFVGMRLAAVTNQSGPQDLAALNVADNPRLLTAFMEGYGYAYTTAACLGTERTGVYVDRGRGEGSQERRGEVIRARVVEGSGVVAIERQKCDTRLRRSSPGRPATVAGHPTRSGRGPKSANTLPSLVGPGFRPPSTRQPCAPPDRRAADGAVSPDTPLLRRRSASSWQAGQLSRPPVNDSGANSGRTAGSSPISTTQSARRTVCRSAGSTISS